MYFDILLKLDRYYESSISSRALERNMKLKKLAKLSANAYKLLLRLN